MIGFFHFIRFSALTVAPARNVSLVSLPLSADGTISGGETTISLAMPETRPVGQYWLQETAAGPQCESSYQILSYLLLEKPITGFYFFSP